MLYFKDGETIFRDDGKGESAFWGHKFVDGDDFIVSFGEELDVDAVGQTTNWTIRSADDSAYGKEGLQPLAVHRKSKANNTDHAWNYKLDHWIFLKLPSSMKQDKRYEVLIDSGVGSDTSGHAFSFDISSLVSEAIHVNLIGYSPDSTVKSADLYLWLGDGGARDYSEFVGNRVWLQNSETGELHESGEVSFWKKSGPDVRGWNLTGSDVWNVDFSDFDEPGTYRLVVDGVGCSPEFEIKNDIYSEPFKYSVRGYFYMRLGEDGEGVSPKPRIPLFIPGTDPEGFTIYLTDLHPFHPVWKARRGDTWDEPHFRLAEDSMFWEHRLPGNPTNPHAVGGHSDAFDWDRHLAHVSNIYDQLLPYILTDGALSDDDLEIAESGNGIPDLIDEARNEVDFFLSIRGVDGGYSQGLTNPSKEKTIMFQAGTTTMAAWANAANAAMLSEAFRISGNKSLMVYYRDAAIEAYDYASRQEDHQLDDLQEIGDTNMRGRDFRMMASGFLYNVTGARKWEDALIADSVVKDGVADVEEVDRHTQTWGSVAYLFSPRKIRYPEVRDNMRESILRQAEERNVSKMDERPSRRSTVNRSWRTPQNLQLVVVAHALLDDGEERERLEKALVLEADWGLGRNPGNIVEMTGLGSRHIVNCYTTGHNDGVPGLHPGQTPYNNLGPWGTNHNGGNPPWFTERGYPEWEAGGWPEQEAHFNSRYTWANGEFTPRQTMRGKMALYAYLKAFYSSQK